MKFINFFPIILLFFLSGCYSKTASHINKVVIVDTEQNLFEEIVRANNEDELRSAVTNLFDWLKKYEDVARTLHPFVSAWLKSNDQVLIEGVVDIVMGVYDITTKTILLGERITNSKNQILDEMTRKHIGVVAIAPGKIALGTAKVATWCIRNPQSPIAQKVTLLALKVSSRVFQMSQAELGRFSKLTENYSSLKLVFGFLSVLRTNVEVKKGLQAIPALYQATQKNDKLAMAQESLNSFVFLSFAMTTIADDMRLISFGPQEKILLGSLRTAKFIIENNGFADYPIMNGLQASIRKKAGYDDATQDAVAKSYDNASPSWKKFFMPFSQKDKRENFRKVAEKNGDLKAIQGISSAVHEGIELALMPKFFRQKIPEAFYDILKTYIFECIQSPFQQKLKLGSQISLSDVGEAARFVIVDVAKFKMSGLADEQGSTFQTRIRDLNSNVKLNGSSFFIPEDAVDYCIAQ